MLSSRRRLVTALAVVAFLYGAAQLVASTDAVERRLRARIDAALRARLGDELSLGAYVGVDLLFRVTFGPIDVPVQHGGPPVVSVARATARASLPALLRGRIEPASILLGDVRVAPGPDGRDLRAIAARVEAMRAARAFGADGAQGGARDLPKLKLRGLLVELPLHGATIALGPVDANVIVHRGAEGPRLDADVILRSGGRAALMAERGSSGWRARLRVAGLGPGALPPGMRGGAARLAEGSLSVDAEAEAPADLSRAVAQVRAEIEGLVLAGERIGPQPVGPLSASAAGTLEWDRAARRVTLRDGAATLLKSLAASVSGELALGPPATFSVALRADRLDYSALLAALPPALAVPPGAPRPSGTLDGRLEVGGPLLAPAEWTLSAALELGRIRDAARHGGRTSLAEPFLHRPPLDAGGRGRELVVGPANPNFVPIGELPEHVIRAVTTAEDGGFFGHAGFDFDELRNAFAQGAEKGRVVRGGSTISQQLAKNLFLASCWEIVEPPRTTRPFSAPCANAFRSSSKSNPAWPKKPPSSAVVTARMTCSGSSPMGTKFGFAGPTTSSRPRPPASSGGLWRNGSASDVRPPWRAASRIRPSSSAAESVHSAGARSGPPTSSRPSSVPEGRGAPGGTASAGGSAASRAE